MGVIIIIRVRNPESVSVSVRAGALIIIRVRNPESGLEPEPDSQYDPLHEPEPDSQTPCQRLVELALLRAGIGSDGGGYTN